MKELDLFLKINNRPISLKLLSTLTIVSFLDKKLVPFGSVCDLLNTLHLPKRVHQDIIDEYYYQVELFFNTVIEPTIQYSYPNEY